MKTLIEVLDANELSYYECLARLLRLPNTERDQEALAIFLEYVKSGVRLECAKRVNKGEYYELLQEQDRGNEDLSRVA